MKNCRIQRHSHEVDLCYWVIVERLLHPLSVRFKKSVSSVSIQNINTLIILKRINVFEYYFAYTCFC